MSAYASVESQRALERRTSSFRPRSFDSANIVNRLLSIHNRTSVTSKSIIFCCAKLQLTRKYAIKCRILVCCQTSKFEGPKEPRASMAMWCSRLGIDRRRCGSLKSSGRTQSQGRAAGMHGGQTSGKAAKGEGGRPYILLTFSAETRAQCGGMPRNDSATRCNRDSVRARSRL